MNADPLVRTAAELVSPDRGILAADESNSTIANRFDDIDTESSLDNRRAYRELLFTTSDMERYVSGVILYDETLRQEAADGTPFVQLLASKGVQAGIKVDQGPQPLAGYPGEMVTEGLTGLRERLKEYADLGASFAKWRAVIEIDPDAGIPTAAGIDANAHALARYAALCQEQGLVPIVEPEVLMEGSHNLAACEAATEHSLATVFVHLRRFGVLLEGVLLKPNMVVSGKTCPTQASVDEVAEATLRCFRRTVPAAVPGIVFLSGGQSPQDATAHLNAMNAMGPSPWELSYSYGRALQQPALAAWLGKPQNVEAAQRAFGQRARLNSLARSGAYDASMELAA